MKLLKTNLVAIAAILLAGATMSFKVIEKSFADTTYYYNSTDVSAGAFANTAHWSTTNAEPCEQDGDRPCKVNVPQGSSLSATLAGKNNSQVLAISIDRKP